MTSFGSVITALGTGIGEDFNISQLKYNRVIILSDADQDGAHIRAILSDLFLSLYEALDYLAGISSLACLRFTESARAISMNMRMMMRRWVRLSKRWEEAIHCRDIRALEKMNPEQLWETTMNPEKRTLVRVTIENAAEAEHLVRVLMGEKADLRREYIFANSNFNREDHFMELGGVVEDGR